MRIYKAKDRIKLKILEPVLDKKTGEPKTDKDGNFTFTDKLVCTFTLAPLTYEQKAEVLGFVTGSEGKYITDRLKSIKAAIKYAVKGLEGFEDSDGNDYKLGFDSDGTLNDETIDDLCNLGREGGVLALACVGLAQNVIDKVVDQAGNPVNGVEIDRGDVKKT